MTSKDWKWIAIACLLVLVAYQVGKYHGENSAESRSRESELAFQKEKEETRKDEFSKEKQAMEKRRREDAREARDLAALQSFRQSQDRQMALVIQAMQAIGQRQGGGPKQSQDRQMTLVREYLETMQNIQRQPSSIGGSPFSSYTTKTPRQGRISYIVGTEDNHSALIGTKLVREGDIIDGVTVVKIYKDEVEFEKDGKRWTQKIGDAPDPAWRY